jgi:hypothetical protein
MDATPAGVELPPVVEALQASVNELSVRQPRRAVGAPVVQASKRPVVIAEDHEPNVVNRECGRTVGRQVLRECDGVPRVPPVERAGGGGGVRDGVIQQVRFPVRRASTVKKPGK